MRDLFLPRLARIADLRDETPDTRTFELHLEGGGNAGGFEFTPGQFVELSVFGYGEAPFCIASSPTRPASLEVTVRRTGQLTDALHELGAGDQVGIRGPLGRGFDLDAARHRDLLFVGGGLGLPPLRGLIWNVLDERDSFGRVTILYGARTPTDLVYKDELRQWGSRTDVELLVTVDRSEPGWGGTVGMVPVLFDMTELRPKETLAYVCGPPVMISFVIQDLLMRGFAADGIISTLERTMQCGVGKCNHCAIGHRTVCCDGPVFTFAEIREMVE